MARKARKTNINNYFRSRIFWGEICRSWPVSSQPRLAEYCEDLQLAAAGLSWSASTLSPRSDNLSLATGLNICPPPHHDLWLWHKQDMMSELFIKQLMPRPYHRSKRQTGKKINCLSFIYEYISYSLSPPLHSEQWNLSISLLFLQRVPLPNNPIQSSFREKRYSVEWDCWKVLVSSYRRTSPSRRGTRGRSWGTSYGRWRRRSPEWDTTSPWTGSTWRRNVSSGATRGKSSV